MKVIKTAADLPADFGKIDGEDHPDTIVASAATQAERERCAKIVESRVAVWKKADGPCAMSLEEECEDIAAAIRRGDQ